MFSRVTLVAASELLEMHTQAAFNQMAIRLELEQVIPANTAMNVQRKRAELVGIVVRKPDTSLDTLEGRMTLGEAVVREAVAIARQGDKYEPQAQLIRALAQDDFSLTWSAIGKAELRPTLPVELGAEINDEVYRLLEANGFSTLGGRLEHFSSL